MGFSGALAIFVKTPDFSAVKTRLAASIGSQQARKFYELALAATEALVKNIKESNLQIYWAVAEPEGMKAKCWESFPTISQGPGELGARLNFIYQELLKKHQYVCFIGADSPHFYTQDLSNAIQLTKQNRGEKFVLGETLDGGFYFFGGSILLPDRAWLAVEYSTQHTANQLRAQLSTCGDVELLKKNFDIDTIDDLLRYQEVSEDQSLLLPKQIELIQWSKVNFAHLFL